MNTQKKFVQNKKVNGIGSDVALLQQQQHTRYPSDNSTTTASLIDSLHDLTIHKSSSLHKYPHSEFNHEIIDEYEDPNACLFVGSLNAKISEDNLSNKLRQHFTKYGHVKSVKVLKDTLNRPYAFIQLHKASDAEAAMRDCLSESGIVLDGRRIRVEKARVNRSLFIARLDKHMDDYQIKELICSIVGDPCVQISLVRLLRDFQGESRGMAFVEFRFREDAIKAFHSLRSQTNLVVDWKSQNFSYSSSPSTIDTTTANIKCPDSVRGGVFVGNLLGNVSLDELKMKFEEFGKICKIELSGKWGNRSSVYANVKYESETSAKEAIINLNNRFALGSTLRVKPDKKTQKAEEEEEEEEIVVEKKDKDWKRFSSDESEESISAKFQQQQIQPMLGYYMPMPYPQFAPPPPPEFYYNPYFQP